MKTDYWSGVANRLKSLSKTALDIATPIVIDASITALVTKACKVVEEKLQKIFTRTIINSSITLAINIAGILILIFAPFGVTVSKYVSIGFFAASGIFFLVRTGLFIKKNGRITVDVGKQVLNKRNLYKGVEAYVLQSFPVISVLYAGIEISSEYIPKLSEVPSISDLAKYLVKQFYKRCVLFWGLLAVYTVLVFWVIKPVILRKYM